MTSSVYAQGEASDFIKQVRAASNSYVSGWKYSLKDLPNRADPKLDDSDWEIASSRYYTRDSLCLFRKSIVIPEAIWATKVEGGKVSLLVNIGASSDIYVDGEHLKSFNVTERIFQAEGQKITLNEKARPGQKFLVAIKAKSDGGYIGSADAKSELDRAVALAERVHAYINRSLVLMSNLVGILTHLATTGICLSFTRRAG